MKITLCLVLIGFAFGSPQSDYDQLKSTLSSLEYDKNLAPNFGKSESLEVGVTAHLFNYEFDEMTKKFHTNVYLRQKFMDQRLGSGRQTGLTLGQDMFEMIWKPDTFVSSAISLKALNEPLANSFVKIAPNGTVFISQLFRVTVPCSKDGQSFECYIKLESYGHNSDEMKYKLIKGTKNSVTMGPANDVTNDFKIKNISWFNKNEALAFGNFSAIVMKITYEIPRSENHMG